MREGAYAPPPARSSPAVRASSSSSLPPPRVSLTAHYTCDTRSIQCIPCRVKPCPWPYPGSGRAPALALGPPLPPAPSERQPTARPSNAVGHGLPVGPGAGPPMHVYPRSNPRHRARRVSWVLRPGAAHGIGGNRGGVARPAQGTPLRICSPFRFHYI